MANIGDLFFQLVADGSGLQASVIKEATKAGDAGAKTLGARLKAGLSAVKIGAGIGTALGAIGVAGLKAGTEVKDALNSIRVGTGATGDALRGLEDDFKAVAASVPDDIGIVGQVIADLNTRTGQTGKGLQELAKRIIDVSRITKTDANANVAASTRLFGDWSIATEDQAAALDKVFRASQLTGAGFTTLQETVVQFGAPLRALGVGFDDALALLGKWEKEGVNVETVLAGLRMAVANFAKQGIDPAQGLPALIDKIKSLDDAQGLLAAKQIVGQRAANDFFRAVKEGRFDVADLSAEIAGGSDTIEQATKDTEDFGDSWGKFANMVKVNFGGLFTAFSGVSQALGPLLYSLPLLGGALGGLAGKAVGSSKAIVGALGNIWGAVAKSSAATKAAQLAGSVAETAYLRGLYLVDAIQGAVSAAWLKVPGSAKISAAAAQAGTAAGRAFSIAASAAIVALPVIVTWVMVQQNNQDSQKRADEISSAVRTIIAQGSIDGMKKALRDLNVAMKIEEGQQTGLSGFFNRLLGASDERGQIQQDIDALTAAIERGVPVIPNTIGAALDHGEATVTAGAQVMVSGVGDVLDQTVADAGTAGEETVQSYASGVLDAQGAVKSAFDTLKNLIKNALRPSQQIARDIGYLTSKTLAKALNDKRPEVRHAAELVQQQATDELAQLIAAGGKTGEKAMEELRRKMHSKNQRVRAAARRVYDIVTGRLNATVPAAGTAGANAAAAYGNALKNGLASLNLSVTFSTKQGKHGPGRAAGGPTRAGMPYWVNENTPRSELYVPSRPGYVLTHEDAMRAAGAGAGGGGDTLTIGQIVINGVGNDVSRPAARRFGRSVLDEVTRGFREQRARSA